MPFLQKNNATNKRNPARALAALRDAVDRATDRARLDGVRDYQPLMFSRRQHAMRECASPLPIRFLTPLRTRRGWRFSEAATAPPKHRIHADAPG
jgi:hypothetical protein